MVLIHRFKIDHPLFQDWTTEIDIDEFDEIYEVVERFKNKLTEFLKDNNLNALRNISQALEIEIINIEHMAQLRQNAAGQLFIISEIY